LIFADFYNFHPPTICILFIFNFSKIISWPTKED